jgi:hypothetical protein
MEVWSDKIRNRWRQIGKAAHVMVKEDHKMPMTDITIPPEALEAAENAFIREKPGAANVHFAVRAACLAMLKAWPGMDIEGFAWASKPDIMMLPLPKESSDDK